MPGPGVEISYQEHTAEGASRRHYSLAAPRDFVIPNGADGSAVDPIVLDANCRVLGIAIFDCAGVQAGTNLTAQVAFDNEASTTMCDLYEQDDPGTQWSPGAIPATGSCIFILTHTFRARRIRFILSQVSTAEVRIKVYGLDGVI
jgi:hypothetical protein